MIILLGRYGLKGIAIILIALLSTHISLRQLWWVILYKVLFYVLAGYVFGAALGFLLRVLRVIGAGAFGCGFWVFVLVLGITVVLVVIFCCMGSCRFIFWIKLLLLFFKGVTAGRVGRGCVVVWLCPLHFFLCLYFVLCTLYFVLCLLSFFFVLVFMLCLFLSQI